jgi:5-methylcytosine-specific restriction endonuclease McrA
MSTRAPRPCQAPGCANLVRSGYCQAHTHLDPKRLYDATTRKDDPTLAMVQRMRNTTRWRSLVKQVRAEQPTCSDPFDVHVIFPAATQQIHHILPAATHPELFYQRDNLTGLCTACHAKIERQERHGISTAHCIRTAPGGT